MTAKQLSQFLYDARKAGIGSYGALQTVLYIAQNGPSRPVDIAVGINVSSAAMTGLIDRLERDGIAERHDATRDRRAFEIHLTTKGREAVENLIQ